MKVLDVLGSRRTAVAALTVITGFYYLFIAVTNCSDTDTNRRAVAHVLAMDTTIHNPNTDWRAITSGAVALTAYILVLIWEYLIAFVMLGASVVWVRDIAGRPGTGRFGADAAAKLSSLGWTMAVLLFAGGFLTVGGEWFRMWASKTWNAESAALQNFLLAAIGLILVHLPDPTCPKPASSSPEVVAPR